MSLVPVIGFSAFAVFSPFGILEAIQNAVENATGWVGLALIAVYSFFIAFVLPLPSELVLAAPINLPYSEAIEAALVILVSALAKTLGSLVAFRVGDEASGPLTNRLEQSGFDVVEWSEQRTVSVLRDYGYVGLALLLTIPFFPDTLSIYAFSVLEEDYVKFAGATFVGSVGRLLVITLVLAPFFDFF
ncbi:MAG TPA: VTT domain-containing protein [Halococcus sp.]|nr:VTT domain-containing protein [Halococcus sp.]